MWLFILVFILLKIIEVIFWCLEKMVFNVNIILDNFLLEVIFVNGFKGLFGFVDI